MINFENNIKGIPETRTTLAKLLLDFIMQQPNINIDKKGEMAVNGNILHNSNIVDVVHDLVRGRKTPFTSNRTRNIGRCFKTSKHSSRIHWQQKSINPFCRSVAISYSSTTFDVSREVGGIVYKYAINAVL